MRFQYFLFSCTEEQLDERTTEGIKAYWDTLVANGVKDYSWEDANTDFNNGVWHAVMSTMMGLGFLPGIEAGAMAHPEGSPERAAGLQMVEQLGSKFKVWGGRGAKLAEVRKAWTPTL